MTRGINSASFEKHDLKIDVGNQTQLLIRNLYSWLSSNDRPVFSEGADSGGVVEMLVFFSNRSWSTRGVAVDIYAPLIHI